MNLHKEINFETEICEHLAANGWLYAEGDAAGYDRARALFPADVLAWVQATQPKSWEILVKNHGDKAGETLLARLRDQLDPLKAALAELGLCADTARLPLLCASSATLDRLRAVLPSDAAAKPRLGQAPRFALAS